LSKRIEGGSLFSEAISADPRIFNRLSVNMVRAGEVSGSLDVTLTRLAEFLEKADKIKSKVKAALFYPLAVLTVAASVVTLMLVFIIPRFKAVFGELVGGAPLPAFTVFVFNLSDSVRHHAPLVALVGLAVVAAIFLFRQTKFGRLTLDQLKLRVPVFGPVFRKSAISRFTRTLGTLMSSGVPILQSLQIVRETAGNMVVSRLITLVHDRVKEGDTITAPLRTTTVFPPMVIGMVDIGEQTGALPDMLTKIADGYDNEVDNAVSAMTSLIEPIMIVLLAIVVGSIVVAMFWPIIILIDRGFGPVDPTTSQSDS